jgi:hypothetical protein
MIPPDPMRMLFVAPPTWASTTDVAAPPTPCMP